METLPIWVSTVESEDKETKSIFKPDAEAILERIPVEKLKANLRKLAQQFTTALEDIKAVGKFRLKEVEIQVEVSAEGGVELIGTATLGGKGAIKLKFVE
jgi:autotransporter translocation and assembly factor TamB